MKQNELFKSYLKQYPNAFGLSVAFRACKVKTSETMGFLQKVIFLDGSEVVFNPNTLEVM